MSQQTDVMQQNIEFESFVVEHNYSDAAITAAYYKLCGLAIDEDEGIHQLYCKMKQLSNDGYPINRFASFLQHFRTQIRLFKENVQALPVTDREKRLLQSLLSSKQLDVLDVYVEGGLYMSVGLVKECAQLCTATVINEQLFTRLKKLEHKEISFYFEQE